MDDLENGSMKVIESLQSWEQTLWEIKENRICDLETMTMGPDPLTQRIHSVQLSLPDGRIYIANLLGLRDKIPNDLATLLEDSRVEKIMHDAGPQCLS